MGDLNQLTIVGRLTRDPEMKEVGSNKVTNFTVATSNRYTKKDGETVETSLFVRVAVWNRMAEVCNEHLAKGREVLVQGPVEVQAWLTQENEPRASLEMKANIVQFLGGKQDREERGEGGYGQRYDKGDDRRDSRRDDRDRDRRSDRDYDRDRDRDDRDRGRRSDRRDRDDRDRDRGRNERYAKSGSGRLEDEDVPF